MYHNPKRRLKTLRNLSLPIFLSLALLVSGCSEDSGSEHSHKGTDAHEHHHEQEEVSSYSAIPGLTLEVFRDAVAGWNIHLVPTNFRFAPEHVNKKSIPGEGHAHLYVDGKKIARVYGAWFHIGKLSKGSHTIRATLNANNHADLVLHGKPIDATKQASQ